MQRFLNFNQAAKINQTLRAKGIEYTLHIHGGCAMCVSELTCEGKEHSIADIYIIMNECVKESFIKLRPDTLNPLNVIVE